MIYCMKKLSASPAKEEETTTTNNKKKTWTELINESVHRSDDIDIGDIDAERNTQLRESELPNNTNIKKRNIYIDRIWNQMLAYVKGLCI
jgi:hypothetical protein